MASKVTKSKQVAKRKSVTSRPTAPALTRNEPIVKREDRIDWYSLYIYAVCLVTLLTCLFSLVSVVRGIVDALWPDPGYFDPYSVPKDSALSADQIKENLTENNQRQAVKSMVNSLTTLIIAGPIYFMHWRLAKRSRAH
jgi:ABC-type Fe3+ transport system permease subunit